MKAEYSTVAKSQPAQVWQIFADTASWPTWNGLVSGVEWIDGPPTQAGSHFILELSQPAFKLKATVKECAEPNRFAFSGNAMGVSLDCALDFTPQAEGSTLMTGAIELSGPAVFLINDDMKQRGVAVFAGWFEALKAESEKLVVAG